MSAINVDKPYTYVRSHMELISIQSVFFFNLLLILFPKLFSFVFPFSAFAGNRLWKTLLRIPHTIIDIRRANRDTHSAHTAHTQHTHTAHTVIGKAT